MSRCGCINSCSCFLEGVITSTATVTVTGAGTELSPYTIQVDAPDAALTIHDLAVFSRDGVIAVGTGASRFRFPFSATIVGCSAAINTAPTGTSLIVDVNKNGTTIFTTQANRPTIAAAAFSSGAESIPDITVIVAGDYLTIDRDQVGSTIAGSDLTVFVHYTRTAP